MALASGDVYCTGGNLLGQLGLGTTSALVDPPVIVSKLTGAKRVHAGRQYTCTEDAAGAVACVGLNTNNQCGVSGPSVLEPVSPTGLPAVSEMSVGMQFACVRTVAGDTYCWGDADEGQAGTGIALGDHPPEPVPMLVGVAARTSVGRTHACAVLAGGEVRCWGDGRTLRLGAMASDTCPNATAGSIPCALQPILADVVPMKLVSVGDGHVCGAATGTGDVWCWGGNDDGQVGVAPSAQELPQRVMLTDVRDVQAGHDHSCAIDAAGTVHCWGGNSAMELGYSGPDSPTPVVIDLPVSARSVHMSDTGDFSCAVLVDETVWCWGAGSSGQLGRGTQVAAAAPGPMVLPCP